MAKYTPMIEQYLRIKADYTDAFLFFRLGDFYEMFFEDALKASQELEITLTSRDGGGTERIPMCGVPHHSAQNYIQQLIEKGFKVAICEQTENPKQAKGVVKREVVQLITPGTVMDGKVLDEKDNNFIASVTDFEDGTFGVIYSDLTTGESKVTLLQGDWIDVIGELYGLSAREVILRDDIEQHVEKLIKERIPVTISHEERVNTPEGLENLVEGLEQNKLRKTSGRLFNYLLRTQKRSLGHLQPVEYYQINQYMKLDLHSKRNLELVETIRTKGKKGSLLWLLDKTITAMGGRMLRQWIERPLLKEQSINERLSIVSTLLEQFFEREGLRERLKEVYDLERLAGRVAFGNVNARDLIQLKKSLEQIPDILELVSKLDHSYTTKLVSEIDPCSELREMLDEGIHEHPPLSVKEGGIIKDGFHEALDRYRDASRNGKEWIAALEKKEREQTGIRSLKIGYNKIFGYFIEVTKANLHLLDDDRYERKQTLSNAERYITPELKEKESLILEAEEKSVELEYEIFLELREQVKQFIPSLQALAKFVSEMDVLQCFATISDEYGYVRPEFSKERKVEIHSGRHPVVEKVMHDNEYVANGCLLEQGREILLITGPNMSGKSTYMRQVALTAILAQIGCFVPAEKAVLPIFDQVFTRIGAADDLVAGQSTFMVEMLEAKNALTKATQDSLILLDEIGRGTSTYDGMALAQAIIEYIHNEIGAKTLFSTHYHELTELEQMLSHLQNVHVRAVEENGRVVFLHKVQEGAADRSYGIHVAELAELPAPLIERAKMILADLESQNQQVNSEEVSTIDTMEPSEDKQLSFFVAENKVKEKELKSSKQENNVVEALLQLDLLEMTPIDAMNELYKLQKKLKNN
ncbi:DNA mismatch repair protein MutS [Bacillus solimangrovi]|uniref:DNA mismatch repair protein MutS n=1 Tax=Bacillus solimangrovi TaxID=1305675 RepID=A0A1E5LJ73_9BACI|nr:DNA mismatch repair protein MutS [Bacillus solimangrovi]OEH94125.1 DNA mismatch repair protein MutS [Bacillus solimangrovi]